MRYNPGYNRFSFFLVVLKCQGQMIKFLIEEDNHLADQSNDQMSG